MSLVLGKKHKFLSSSPSLEWSTGEKTIPWESHYSYWHWRWDPIKNLDFQRHKNDATCHCLDQAGLRSNKFSLSSLGLERIHFIDGHGTLLKSFPSLLPWQFHTVISCFWTAKQVSRPPKMMPVMPFHSWDGHHFFGFTINSLAVGKLTMKCLADKPLLQ